MTVVFSLEREHLGNSLCQRRSTLLSQTATRTLFAPQGTVIAAVRHKNLKPKLQERLP